MTNPTILLAEDDPSSSDVLREILEIDDYAVELAETADAVLAALRARRFAAVVLDLTMPGMTRDQFIDGLRELPERSPLIVFSARPALEVREIAETLGAAAILPKPSRMDKILGAVGRVARPTA